MMFDVWNNPPMWHAINVHLPLVLAILGLPLVCVLTITRGRSRAMRWGMVAFYAIMSLGAVYAMWTGERAMGALSNTLPKAAWDQVNLHESMAEKVWMLGAATTLLLLLVNIPRVWARQTFLALSLVASVVTCVWVIATGHTGGTAVYAFGLGTPGTEFASNTNTPAPPTPRLAAELAPRAGAPTTAPIVSAPASIATPAPPVPSAEVAPTINVVKAVSFQHDIKPILAARCEECHAGSEIKGGYDISTVASIIKGGRKASPAVVPGNPDGSALMQYVLGARNPQMPKGAKPLDPAQVTLLRNWISQGAIDDSDGAQTPVKTAATPAKTQASSQPVSSAAPSAVPAPAAPATSTSAVASTSPSTTRVVDADHPNRVYDADEHLATWNPQSVNWSITDNAAVRRYLRLQQVPVVPAPKQMPALAQNPIDAFVMPHWPAGSEPQLCDDSTFARRVYLDVIGMVPTADEVEKFVKDTDKNKRDKLVDQLLARDDDYAANWVPWWEDALCSSGQHQGGVGTHGNYREWLLKSFKENKAFDTMVLELLDPEMPNHPDRYILTSSHMVTVQSAADTAQVFLGTAIKCASCHSHFENAEWPQARAVAFASFFSQNDMEIIRCERKTGQFVPAAFPFQLPGAPRTVPTEKNLRLRRVAQLIVDPANPRFAKSIVNRLWKRYTGLGIFEPADDYRLDHPPANPQLLDWLADDFMRAGFNIKHTIRLILTSRAYQLKFDPKLADHYDTAKPTAPRYMRSPTLRRLTAEQLLDSIRVVMTQQDSLAKRTYTEDESTELLRALGKSSTRNQVSTGRSEDSAVVQALQFMNGPEYHDRIYNGDLVKTLAAIEDPGQLIDRMYWSVLSRAPSAEERELGIKFLAAAPVKSPTTAPSENIWIDDDLPKDAKATGNWVFATAPDPVFSGKKSHVSTSTGPAQHVFTGAKFTVAPTDKLFTYVWIDPANPPKEILIQWHAVGSEWNHRAYWGDDQIEYTPRKKIGDLPKAGGWVRLEVTARQLGFNDPTTVVDGMSFDTVDGKTYWDKTGQLPTVPVRDTETIGDMLWALISSPEFQYIK